MKMLRGISHKVAKKSEMKTAIYDAKLSSKEEDI